MKHNIACSLYIVSTKSQETVSNLFSEIKRIKELKKKKTERKGKKKYFKKKKSFKKKSEIYIREADAICPGLSTDEHIL